MSDVRVLSIRLPEHIHKKLQDAANEDQRSINNFVVKALREKLGLPPLRRVSAPTVTSSEPVGFVPLGDVPEFIERKEEGNDEQS